MRKMINEVTNRKSENRECSGLKVSTVAIMIMATIIVMMGMFFYVVFLSPSNINGPSLGYFERKVDKDGKDTEPEINIMSLNHEIHEMGRLTTVEKTFKYSMVFSKGDIPWITKSGFSMDYSVHVCAGVDLEKVNVREQDGTIYINIPDAEEHEFYVDLDTVEIYDKHHALFEGDGKDDLQKALEIAEADARDKVDTDSLYDRAENKAEKLIRNLVEETVGSDVKVIFE